jgi:hypothetical protein
MTASGEKICRTQRVTGPDLNAGRIRIPSVKTSLAKIILTDRPWSVTIVLRGTELTCAWNPRMGPDQERSGVLTVGPLLSQLVVEGEVLAVAVTRDERFTLD